MAKKHQSKETASLGGANGLGVRETAEYLAKKREQGWPGSVSIHNLPLGGRARRRTQDDYRAPDRLDTAAE